MTIAHVAIGDSGADARAKINASIDKANLVDDKAAVTALAAVDAARASGDANEAEARRADIAGEAAARQSAIAGLTADTHVAVVTDISRPGERPDLHTTSIYGRPEDTPPLGANRAVVTAAGKVVTITGDGIVAPRALYRLQPGRKYLVRAFVSRIVNSADPNNDRVELRAAWMDRFAVGVSSVVLDNVTNLTTGSGSVMLSAVVSAAAGDNVDVVAPGAAVYWRPYVRAYGSTCQTAEESISVLDVTDFGTYAPDVDAIDARLTAQESLGLGARTAALEATVGTPNLKRYPAVGDLIADDVPGTVDRVEVVGDGSTRIFARVGSEPAHDGKAQSADGQWWLDVTDTVSLRALGAPGDGSDATAEYVQALAMPAELHVPDGEYLIDPSVSNPLGKRAKGNGRLLRRYTNGVGGEAFDQINSYADDQFIQGRIFMWHWIDLLQRVQPINVVFSGDSTTEGANVTDGYKLHTLVQKEAWRRGYFGVKAFNRGHSGSTSAQWLASFLASDLADMEYGVPDVYFVRFGINDIYVDTFNGYTVDQAVARFASNIRSGLQTIRASYDLNEMSVVLCVPNAALDYSGRDNRFYEAVRSVIVQAALDYQCAMIDLYAWGRDARSSTYMLDTVPEDGGHIHPNNAWAASLVTQYYDLLFPSGQSMLSATQLWNISGSEPAFPALVSNNAPYTYEPMISHTRGLGSNGWPVDGGVFTLRQRDKIVGQFCWGYAGSRPSIFFRHARVDGPNTDLDDDWTAWAPLHATGTLSGATTSQIASGLTRYLGCNGAQFFETQTAWLMPSDGRFVGLRVKAADGPPGTGQSYTYTVRKNSVSTSLTVTLTGSTASGSIVGSVDYVAGDYITIELVTSAAAAIGGHFYALLSAG